MLFVNKKHVLFVKTGNMKKLNTKTGQNDPSFPTLGSSQATASFLTKQQNLKNNELEEKVTSHTKYEENKSTLLKNTTNKVKNMMETNSEECDGIPTGIGNMKAFFENSGNKSSLNDKKSTQCINIERVNNTNKSNSLKETNDVETRLPDLLDSSDVQVSKFLATVSKLSAEKEKKTGNGKLDMAELAAALSSVTNHENVQGVTRSLKRMENNNAQVEQKIKHTSESQGSFVTAESSQENKSSTEKFHEKQLTRTESSFSHSKTVTSSSTKSQIDTTKASFDTPSNLANTNTSFLLSIISQASAASSEQAKGDLPMNGRNDRQSIPAFIPMKNSVISELKNIINDDPAPVPNLPKRSFNATPRGFQTPDLAGQRKKSEPPSQVSSSDPGVKKLVYSQYREMLKSYTNTN